MKFVANQVVNIVDRVTPQGARVGDQILWSSHNPNNSDIPSYLKVNRLYTVIQIEEQDGDFIAVVNCESQYSMSSSWIGGEYDVIIEAILPPTISKFPGASLQFESMQELFKMKELLGTSNRKSSGCAYDVWNSMNDAYIKFKKCGVL